MNKNPSILPVTARLLTPAEMEQGQIAHWRRLMANDRAFATPFLSFAYVMAASEVFHGVRICDIRQDGRTVAFFPFQYRSVGHRMLGIGERIGGELSDYFGIVAESGTTISPRTLLRLAGLGTIVFTHLDESQIRFGLKGEGPKSGLRIEFHDGATRFWEQLRRRDKKFVADTDRRERRLAEQNGPLRFVFRHPEPERHLKHLIAAKRAQYARTGVGDAMARVTAIEFLELLSRCTDPDCCATLSTLHAGETWVASHFGLMYGKTLHYWFPVYNPDLRSFAPGRLLVKAIIDGCGDIGVSCIDRGLGDTPAKRDFSTMEHEFLSGVWLRPTASALVYRAALSLRWRMQRWGAIARGKHTPDSSDQ